MLKHFTLIGFISISLAAPAQTVLKKDILHEKGSILVTRHEVSHSNKKVDCYGHVDLLTGLTPKAQAGADKHLGGLLNEHIQLCDEFEKNRTYDYNYTAKTSLHRLDPKTGIATFYSYYDGYTGGAHPFSGTYQLALDLKTGEILNLKNSLSAKTNFEEKLICALNAQIQECKNSDDIECEAINETYVEHINYYKIEFDDRNGVNVVSDRLCHACTGSELFINIPKTVAEKYFPPKMTDLMLKEKVTETSTSNCF